MKSKIVWFAVIAAAIVAGGCVILWIYRHLREEDKIRARMHWQKLREDADVQKHIDSERWENRSLIGFNQPVASPT